MDDEEMLPPLPASSPPAAGGAKLNTPSSTPSKNPKKRLAPDIEDDDTPSTKKARGDSKKATPTPRKRKAPGKDVLKGVPMGKNLDICSKEDKTLIEWREAGRTWDDIRKKWTEMTGDVTARSTLPNRYSRLRSNFVVIKEEHNALLLEAKQEVEASFEREKWVLIGKAMEEKGADKYKPMDLSMQYKNLMKMGMEFMNERDQTTAGRSNSNAWAASGAVEE